MTYIDIIPRASFSGRALFNIDTTKPIIRYVYVYLISQSFLHTSFLENKSDSFVKKTATTTYTNKPTYKSIAPHIIRGELIVKK